MSEPISLTTQAAVTRAPAALPAGSNSPQDLDALRTAVANASPQPPQTIDVSSAAPQVGGAVESSFRSPGDSILEGIAGLKDGYEESLGAIENRIERLASGDPMKIGNNFSETVALQLDIARWSMSVMGVDNSAKAGTNTIKELSKGG